MSGKFTKRYLSRIVYAVLLIGLLLFLNNEASCLMISPQNVQAIAIYRIASYLALNPQPNQIVFNVTDSSLINSLVSSIDFSIERDCSEMGALAEEIVCFKFNDGSIQVYALFGKWSHFSKVGFWGSCYFVSATGRTLYQNNAQ